MPDYTYLGMDKIFSTDNPNINSNEIICGPSGSGKTMSFLLPRVLHSKETNLVIPLIKEEYLWNIKNALEDNGYNVKIMDLTNSIESDDVVIYDPFDYIKSYEDINNLASRIVESVPTSNSERYWATAAQSMLAAEIMLVYLNSIYSGEKASFKDVLLIHHSLRASNSELVRTNIDCLIERADYLYQDSGIYSLWLTVKDLANKTFSCVFSFVNNYLNNLILEAEALKIMRGKKHLQIAELFEQSDKPRALIILSSPFEKNQTAYVNLLYADVLRLAFKFAQKNGPLKRRLHIFFDDFACNSKLASFEDYISFFRSSGISTTIMLQSISQLENLYGISAAKTICNNSDTQIFLSSNELHTIELMSKKVNLPIDKIASMGIEKLLICRRGQAATIANRYPILKDVKYAKYFMKKEGVMNRNEYNNDEPVESLSG